MIPVCIAAAMMAASPVLLTNGDFEHGMEAWNSRHPWYAQPKDAGASITTPSVSPLATIVPLLVILAVLAVVIAVLL